MSVIGKYPGVYPEITDLSQITESASTSILAAVGEAPKGSIFKRKYITSAGALSNTFGTPDLKYGYMLHCMTCALSDAGESYVVRVCSEDSKYAALKVPAETESSISPFYEGFSLTDVDNSEDESFFYQYKMAKDEEGNLTGYYELKDGKRQLVLDDAGNPVIDETTIMTYLGENPNNSDIRVRMEETTVLPSAKKATNITFTKETVESTDVYKAIVHTGSVDHGLKANDKVIISGANVTAYNGNFTVESVRGGDTTAYVVTKDDGSITSNFYVEEEPTDQVSEVFNNSRKWYTGVPQNNYVYRFFKMDDYTTTDRQYFFTPASQLESAVITGYYIPVMSTNSSDPKYYFVKVDSATSTLARSIGNPLFLYPGAATQYGTYTGEDDYEDLNIAPCRFLVNNSTYASATDLYYDETTGEWKSDLAVPQVADYTVSYTSSSQPIFFIYNGKDRYLKDGSYIYVSPALETPVVVEGITDTSGKVEDGTLTINVDSDYNVMLKRFVEEGAVVYSDESLLNAVASADIGEYTYSSLTPVVTTAYSFTYKLNSEVTSAPSSLRYVKSPANNERKFDVFVYEVTDGSYSLKETFNDCTMYSNVDGYGVQTLVTSKINDKSSIIKVVLNETLLNMFEADQIPFPIMTSVTTGQLTGGSTEEAATSSDVMKGWDLFVDRDQVTVNIMLECGYCSESNQSIKQKILEVAETRRDCFCVFDTPVTVTKSGTDQVVEDYRKNTLGIDSYRAALYSPWVKVYDSFTGTSNVLLPPSGFVAGVIARTDQNRGVWVAPAGMNNGAIACAALTPVGLTQDYTTDEQGSIYENGINYLCKKSGMYLVWGQKTLQFKKSALDRINVVRTVIYIETTLRDAAKWHLFEQNTAYKRAQITMQFEAWLEPIKAAGGLTDFKVVCDDTNNTSEIIMNNQLYIDIYIKPTYAIEFIKLNTIVQRADATIGITA